jgi:polar amino acid transport system substrate-binding protein
MRKRFAICILLFSNAVQASDSLTFAMSDALEMPFINQHKTNKQTLPGILAEWNVALAKQLGKKPVFSMYPSKRIVRVMDDGTADALCYVLPQWLPAELADKLIWSPPFLTDQERVVFRNDQKPVTQISDLYPQRLGTVLGYKYASLQGDLDTKKILRDDAPTESLSFEKLFRGRYHHMVAHDMTTAWYRKTEPRMKSYLSSSFVVTSYQAKCAFSPTAGLSEQDLKAAFAEMDKRGVLTDILQRYQ